MKVPYNWLKTYIDFPYSPQELANKLTMAGLEVESVEYLGQGLKDIIVAEIEEVEPHPDADKLSLCKVNTGNDQLQIVCGAPNVSAGIKVPVATTGTKLPGGMIIEKVKLRGVTSEGMICSEDELGLKEERAEGIMVLDDDIEPGQKFVKSIGLDEYVLKLDLTPNYSRCLGLLGIAREIKSMLKNKNVKYPEIDITAIDKKSKDLAEVEIEDPDLCPRYTARVIKNVEIKPSPDWMQQRLKSAGIRPINNIVDITNYVLLEYNQPLHAFDYDKIKDGKIIVRRAKDNEQIITLDQQKRELDRETLVIADPEKAVAIAGVMGAANSEVTEKTVNILLESAYFKPGNIRKTARKLGLPSEASYRFERGVDIENLITASNRAAYLMQEYADADIAQSVIDQYPKAFTEKKIELDINRANIILGLELEIENIKKMLERLELKSEEIYSDILEVTLPSYRNDIELEADLIEEIARMYGYNQIPVTMPESKQQGKRTESQKIRNQVRNFMVASGMDEIISFSLMDKEIYEKLNISEDSILRNWVEIKNPLNESFSIMRTSLIPNMIKIISDNSKRQQNEISFFEIGKVFFNNLKQKNNVPVEKRVLAGGSMGYPDDIWGNAAADFYYLKGVIENLFKRLGLKVPVFSPIKIPYLHPGRTAKIIYNDKDMGIIGELKPVIIEEFDLNKGTSIFQFDFKVLEEEVNPDKYKYKSLAKYPPVSRDLALIVSKDIPAIEILDEIDKAGGQILKQVNLFDIYTGKQIEENCKSLAFELLFQAEDKTLTDEEVNQVFSGIIEELKEKFDISVRK